MANLKTFAAMAVLVKALTTVFMMLLNFTHLWILQYMNTVDATLIKKVLSSVQLKSENVLSCE